MPTSRQNAVNIGLDKDGSLERGPVTSGDNGSRGETRDRTKRIANWNYVGIRNLFHPSFFFSARAHQKGEGWFLDLG